jgi:putative component of membrane protein insertase Oxa1/YidC/SpoIIIJ protein YidD/TM2 domain-containing membrane protein YozV
MVSFSRALPFAGAVLITACAGIAAATGIPRDDFGRLARIRDETSHALEASEPEPQRGGGRAPLIGGLYLYRFVLSSQDAGRCRLDPSCSHFAEDAVIRAGPLRGVLMASDRLQRCHPMAGRYYERDAAGLMIDPIDPYLGPGPGSVAHAASPGEPSDASASSHRARSPLVAAALSAIIPGTGKVYAGRPLDGLAATLATAIPLTFSIQNFQRDGASSVRGWFHGSLAAGFYFGNVWGSAQAARIENAGRVPPVEPDHRSRLDRFVDVAVARQDSLAADAPAGEAGELRYEAALALYAAGRYESAAARMLDVADRERGSELGTRARFFQAMSHAQEHHWHAAANAMRLAAEGIDDPADSLLLKHGIGLLDSASRAQGVSESRARMASAFLPGAGQLYAHDPGAALKALSVNALFGYYVYDAGRTRSYAELAIAAIPMFWRYYRGNMLAAGRSAREFNARTGGEVVDDLHDALDLPRPATAGTSGR